MQLTRPLVIIALSLWSGSVWSAANLDGPERNITLQECIRLALEKNLDVQISRRGPEISAYNLRAAYGVYDPTLQFGVGGNKSVRSSGTDEQGRPVPPSEFETLYFGQNGGFLGGNLPVGGMSYSIGFGLNKSDITLPGFPPYSEYNATAAMAEVRLPLLRDFWMDGFRTTIEINKENLNRSELDLRLQIMTTLLAVEQAYYDLIYSREYIQVQQTAFEAADRLLKENRKRVEVGAMAPLEEKSAEAQAAASRALLIAAQGDYGTRMRILKNLITDDYSPLRDVVLNPTEDLAAIPTSPQVQESWLNGLTLRPDLERLRLALRQLNIQIRYQKNQLYPMVDLVGSYSQSSSVRTGFDDNFEDIGRGRYPSYGIGLQVAIPLGNVSARNTLRARRAELEQALLSLKKQEQVVMVEIDNAIAVVRTNFERVGATKQAREFAKDAWDAEQKKLDNGKSTSYEVLLKQRDYIRTLSDEIQALADYNKALADLSFREGTILERNNLDIRVR